MASVLNSNKDGQQNPAGQSQPASSNPFAGRVLSLRSNRGRVAFLRQNSVEAFSSTPKQIGLPEIVPLSSTGGAYPPTAAEDNIRRKPWFGHVDHFLDEKKLRDVCELGVGRYDPFLALVQSLLLGNFLLASQICVVNRCWAPACLFALQHCVPSTQRTEIKWSLRARDLVPGAPVSKEERRLIRRRSTRLRLGKDAELLKTQEGMLRILYGLEDSGSGQAPVTTCWSPSLDDDEDDGNEVGRIGVGCCARATQDERTLKLWEASKHAAACGIGNNNDSEDVGCWGEYPELARAICEPALSTLKHFLDKVMAEEGRGNDDFVFNELRTIASILVRFWVDYGLPVISLERLLDERLRYMAAPLASFVLSEEDPMTCEAFINALTSGFWIRVTRAAIRSGKGVPELEEVLSQMTVDGGLATREEEGGGPEDEQVADDACYSITISGEEIAQAIPVTGSESCPGGRSIVRVFSCGHAVAAANEDKSHPTPMYSACPSCVQAHMAL